ncbi:MAG: transporter, partial [Armatimonadota bacterium]
RLRVTGGMRRSPVIGAAMLWAILGGCPQATRGAGLNTDVALTPPKDGTIVRVQWRGSELGGDRTPLGRRADMDVQPITFVHGATERLAILGTVPIVHREIVFGSGMRKRDTGVADIPLLAKYRFLQHDRPGQTTRWAAIAGVEAPSFDADFSSDSFDPILGTVWTYQRRDWWVDWDVVYKFNTGAGLDSDDQLRADVAYSHRVLEGQNRKLGPWGLYVIGEWNSRHITDGSSQMFLSPGVQFITARWILEAGVQLPTHQHMRAPRLETDDTVVVSFRFQF